MTKIGFRCPWAQDEPETPQAKVQEKLQITPAMEHAAEIQMRLTELEEFIVTVKFAKLRRQEKLGTVQTYSFLLKSLMIIQPNAGMVEFGAVDIDVDE